MRTIMVLILFCLPSAFAGGDFPFPLDQSAGYQVKQRWSTETGSQQIEILENSEGEQQVILHDFTRLESTLLKRVR